MEPFDRDIRVADLEGNIGVGVGLLIRDVRAIAANGFNLDTVGANITIR